MSIDFLNFHKQIIWDIKRMFDIIYSTDCIKYPLTGIGRYAYELAKQLQRRDNNFSLMFSHGLNITDALTIAGESQAPVQSIKRRLQKSKLVSDVYRLTYPVAKSLSLRKYKDAIYHGPNFYLPPNVKHAVATFHDLSIFHWPQFHPAGRVHLMRKELVNTVKRATILLTVSDFIKKELVEYFDIDEERIIVSPLGFNDDFRVRESSDCEGILKKYHLKYGGYILYTGTIEPRKNLLTLLQAFDGLNLNDKRRFPLVLSGYKGWENDIIYRYLERGKREGWLIYLGFVPSADLPTLFSAALGFAFPSIYEGFGLPALESMASGTPVICSSAASLPEVVGNAALQHNPKDVDQLKAHLERLISDAQLRCELSEAGLTRATQFSWSKCADQTILAYERVAEKL